MEKINETKNWFFEKIKKLATSFKTNKEKSWEDTNYQYQESIGDIPKDLEDTKSIRNEYNEQQYIN